MKKEKNIILKLTQGIYTSKYKLLFKNITKKILLLISFLWKLKIIYGYVFNNFVKKDIFVFLKNYNRISFFYFKNIYLKKKELTKIIKWEKNTLHLVKTYNGYLIKKGLTSVVIGGYLFCNLF